MWSLICCFIYTYNQTSGSVVNRQISQCFTTSLSRTESLCATWDNFISQILKFQLHSNLSVIVFHCHFSVTVIFLLWCCFCMHFRICGFSQAYSDIFSREKYIRAKHQRSINALKQCLKLLLLELSDSTGPQHGKSFFQPTQNPHVGLCVAPVELTCSINQSIQSIKL